MFQICIAVLGACGMSVPLCKGFWLWHYRPRPGFLRFLSLRFLRCRLVSLTSVLKDSVSAADSALDSTPWCVCPVLISSLSVLLEEYGPISRGAGSPDASPVSSSLSMGTIPRDDQSALVPSDSDPDPPLKPTVDSDPDDDFGATCCDHSGLEHMPSMANPFAISFPCTLTCGPYTHIQPTPKKVKPQQECQRFKVQALSQLDAIANEGLQAAEAELTTMAWARNQQIWLRLDQPHGTRMHCEIVDNHGEPLQMSNQELYSVMVQINWTLKTQALANMQVQWRPKSAGKWHPFQWEAILHCPTAEGHRAVPSSVSRTGDCMHVWLAG